jgi:hypothetical protein
MRWPRRPLGFCADSSRAHVESSQTVADGRPIELSLRVEPHVGMGIVDAYLSIVSEPARAWLHGENGEASHVALATSVRRARDLPCAGSRLGGDHMRALVDT